MMRIVCGYVQSEVAMFNDRGTLIWSSPDSLQSQSKLLLTGSSLIHDEVSTLNSMFSLMYFYAY